MPRGHSVGIRQVQQAHDFRALLARAQATGETLVSRPWAIGQICFYQTVTDRHIAVLHD